MLFLTTSIYGNSLFKTISFVVSICGTRQRALGKENKTSVAGSTGEELRKPAEHTLSLSPDDRTKEKQAKAGLPWIKHTPCEPSHATALTPWGHAVTSLSSDARSRRDGDGGEQTVAIVEKLKTTKCQDAEPFSSQNNP